MDGQRMDRQRTEGRPGRTTHKHKPLAARCWRLRRQNTKSWFYLVARDAGFQRRPPFQHHRARILRDCMEVAHDIQTIYTRYHRIKVCKSETVQLSNNNDRRSSHALNKTQVLSSQVDEIKEIHHSDDKGECRARGKFENLGLQKCVLQYWNPQIFCIEVCVKDWKYETI